MSSFESREGEQSPSSPNLASNLSSSKIYERRKNREKEEEAAESEIGRDVFNEESPEINDLDESVDKKYKEKLRQMNTKKKVDFYNSDDSDDNRQDGNDNEIDEEDDESDVGIASEDDKDDEKPTRYPVQQNTSPFPSSEGSSSTSNEKNVFDDEENDPKYRGFKGFMRRMTMVDDLDDIPESLKKKKSNIEDEDEDGGFFSKFINFGGSGLIPGASKDEPSKKGDEEAQDNNEEDIEMRTFQQEAKDILQAHVHESRNKGNHPSADTSHSGGDHFDETTLKESLASGNDSFLAPNPDYYLRDEVAAYEDDSFITPPERVRGGVLSSLLKLYQNPQEASRSRLTLVSSENSPANTPAYEKDEFLSPGDHHHHSSTLKGKLKNFAGKKKVSIDDNNLEQQQDALKKHRKNASFGDIGELLGSNSKKKLMSNTNLPSFNKPNIKKISAGLKKTRRENTQARITVHIAETLQRQRFIFRICKALMLYGAPTHRLEEYLTMTARVLEIDAQFIYLPGCMIISFGDATTRTSEVQLVRCAQGLDLYKLHRAHRVYKRVIHDLIGVEDASAAIDDLLSSKPLFPPWMCVLIYAFSSSMITPLAFGGGWVDVPISFGIGGCVGALQFYISPRSNLYSNVFEVTASIVVSFIGRALGSIKGSNICFAAIVQGPLALILPGYIILCGALELQSRNLVSGAVRMFYAIIYSLFLGFGLTLGSALYGWIDSNATSATTCSNTVNAWYRFIFVPGFTLGLALINQAKWFQLPIMLFISSAGYVVTYFSSKYFYDSTEFTASLASFVIGVLGNLYSRIWKGIAVSAMLPGIFLQVPGGVGSQQTLLVGVENANRITGNKTATSSSDTSGIEFGITMTQIVIGISVGLFASTIVVYPFGKKSTSLFTL